MHVEGTKITLDSDDNIFKNLEKIVDNSALEEQDRSSEEGKKETRKEEEKKIESQESTKIQGQKGVSNKEEISITSEIAKKSQIGSIFENFGKEVDDDDQMELITSLKKIIGKNKKVKSLEGSLLEITEKLRSVMTNQIAKADPLERAREVMKAFDNEFTNLSDIAKVKVQVAYEAKIFHDISQNIRNDINNLDVCIKDLRRNLDRGKTLYIQCTKSENHVSEVVEKIKAKEAEIQLETNLLASPNVKILDIEKRMSKVNDEIRILNDEKDKKLKIFALL